MTNWPLVEIFAVGMRYVLHVLPSEARSSLQGGKLSARYGLGGVAPPMSG